MWQAKNASADVLCSHTPGKSSLCRGRPKPQILEAAQHLPGRLCAAGEAGVPSRDAKYVAPKT
jgi:hypothetical protein